MSIAQTSVSSRFPAVVGQLYHADPNDEVQSGINSPPQTKQVSTVTFTAPTGDSVLTVNGESVTYSSDGSPTASEHAAGLIALAQANGIMGAAVEFEESSAGVIQITSLWPGVAFSVSCTNGGEVPAVATGTANDEADPIAFGVALISLDWSEQEQVLIQSSDLTGTSGTKLVSIPGAYLGNQVDTYTVTYDAGVLINVAVEVNGANYSGSHLMATSLSASLTAIAAQINAALPANTVDVTATTTTLVFTSEIDGMPFVSEMSFGTGRTTGAYTKATTGSDYDISKAFVGVSKHSYQVEEDDEYPGNSVLPYVKKGVVAVEATEAVTVGGQVWVELSTGKFYGSASAALRSPLPLSVARWERSLYEAGLGVNLLRVNA